MATPTIKFTATKLSAMGKRGILSPDADGYYTLVIGGLNTFNSAGEYYTLEGARELFESSSAFMRRVQSGSLKGEVGHPKMQPGMTKNDYISRILRIEESNVCCHIQSVWLDTLFGRNNPRFHNSALVAIMAKLRPAGPKGPALAEALENSKENVSFSIRALTNDYYVRGKVHRVLNTIVCWDWVNEPGIAIANKWDHPALENLAEFRVTPSQIATIAHQRIPLVTMESAQLAQEILLTLQQPHPPIYTSW